MIEKLMEQASSDHPLKQARSQEHRYFDDFVEVMSFLKKNLSEKNYTSIQKNCN